MTKIIVGIVCRENFAKLSIELIIIITAQSKKRVILRKCLSASTISSALDINIDCAVLSGTPKNLQWIDAKSFTKVGAKPPDLLRTITLI